MDSEVYWKTASTLTIGVSWRLLSSVVPSVKGPDSTFFRLSFTSTNCSSTSTLCCSASRHASSFCLRRASNEACCLGSEDNKLLSVPMWSVQIFESYRHCRCTLAGAELLFGFPLLFLEVCQTDFHLLPLFLQAITLLDVTPHVCLCAVLAQLYLNCTGASW